MQSPPLPSPIAQLESQSTCYICFEQCEQQPIVCSCQTMWCHPECQQRLIDSKGDAICNVCRSQYTNVISRKKRRSCQGADIVGIGVIFLSFSGGGFLTWVYVCYPTETHLLVEAVLLFFAGLFVAVQTTQRLRVTTDEWNVISNSDSKV